MYIKPFVKKVLLTHLLLFGTILTVLAQTALKGHVATETGTAVPGAVVKIKDKPGVTITDANGNFSVSYSKPAALTVSAMGYAAFETVLNAQTSIEIVLKEQVTQLNDVVVTAIGVKREKRLLTYSTQEIKSEELTRAKEPNVINAMTGKLSGVQITSSSGTAGSSTRIVVRGAVSVNGNNEALFVVDGVPVDNSETGNIGGGAAGAGSSRIIDIDPNNIESVNVLKGAAATALYGSRGASGAVLITTKSGSLNKKASITFTSDYSFEKGLFPQNQHLYSQGTGGVFYNGEDRKTSASWGARMDTLLINGKKAPVYDPFSYFRTGHTTNNTLSIGGGNNNSTYFISYSYFNQQGISPNNDFKRHSFFTKYTTNIVKNLTTTFQLGYTNSAQERLPEGASNGPLFVVLVQPISWNPYPVLNPDGTQRLYRFSRNAPLWTLDNISNTAIVNRFLPVTTFNYTANKWLTVTERLGADIYTEQDKYTENPSAAIGLKGQIKDQVINYRQFNHDLIINANQKFGKFDLNLLLGNNYNSIYSQYTNLTGTGLVIKDFYNVSAGSTLTGSEGHSSQRKIGFYSQANMEYDKFLILSLTGRYDGSSVLYQQKQFYPYGSVAGGVIFTHFLPENVTQVLNFGKVRLSYATVGNDAVGPYSLNTPYILAGRNTNAGYFPFPYQGQPGFLQSATLGNPYLQNEKLKEFETGLELKFLNNRISFEGSYFNRKSINGIIPGIQISNATGYGGTTVNSASISNKGVELLLNATPVQSKDFSWDVSVNFTRIRNKVLEINNEKGITQLGRVIVGQPYNIFYGVRYKRNAGGQMLIDDAGLPVVDSEQGVVGNANPDWTGGITNSFRYKQFGLSFFFDVKMHGDVQNDVESVAFFYGTAKVTENRAPFVASGVNETTGLPNTVKVDAQTYYQSRQYESSIQDGTYVKLRNVSLSYQLLPATIIKTPFKSASLTVTGRNLWIYSPHFTGADPEVSSYGSSNGAQGIYAFSTPTARSFNLSLKLGF
ncbi:SusC/RagA family TonB-linked outer membrane protein [Mucilaginibacter phyllosphaerae]|uniref:SusC/RagA family TonB-linked outer membrane protein n=1 Tax=Mucilaginibacter phyllosphaerae TaxID=1812349 RepID=A0A4Y8ACA3_9SPHI|nr:SusC/RagA family TonB-linked outer membrane protein [Mucilaginibacter phyllosphaerae]TEW65719.1 SusC/RagA family TonB-linked outer membrane protein [Mucilaginibacter phyllosphaerae]